MGILKDPQCGAAKESPRSWYFLALCRRILNSQLQDGCATSRQDEGEGQGAELDEPVAFCRERRNVLRSFRNISVINYTMWHSLQQRSEIYFIFKLACPHLDSRGVARVVDFLVVTMLCLQYPIFLQFV